MFFNTNPESRYWLEELSKARNGFGSRVDRPAHYNHALQQLYGSAHECLFGISCARHFASVERLPFMRRHYHNLEALGKAMFSIRDRDKVIQDAHYALDNWHRRTTRYEEMQDFDADMLEYVKQQDEMKLNRMGAALDCLKEIGMDTPESNELLQQIKDIFLNS
jgi:hypothetical protein